MSDTPALQMIEPVRSRYAEAARSRSHGYSYGGFGNDTHVFTRIPMSGNVTQC
jgi:hypothetical protein